MGVDTKWLAKHLEEQEARMSDRELYEEGLLMDLEKAKARIEELIAERDEAWNRAAHAEEMWGRVEVKLTEVEKDAKRADAIWSDNYEALKAKLAKATEEAEKYQHAFAAQSRKLQAVLHIDGVRTTLAELTGEQK